MNNSNPRITTHPSYTSSTIALCAAVCVVGVLTTHPLQRKIVGIEAIGLLILQLSIVVQRRWNRMSGLACILLGSLLTTISLGLGIVFPMNLIERSAFVGGMFGPVVLLLGLYPLHKSVSRWLTGISTALLIYSAVVNGWAAQLSHQQLLGAIMLTILAWDAAGHAISLGKEVGRGSRSFVVSSVHTVGTLTVGMGGILIADVFNRLRAVAIPAASFTLLLGVLLLLLFALYLGDLERS